MSNIKLYQQKGRKPKHICNWKTSEFIIQPNRSNRIKYQRLHQSFPPSADLQAVLMLYI